MTDETRINLLNMADSYERGGHPDVADIMRRNANKWMPAFATPNPEPIIIELETAEGVIG